MEAQAVVEKAVGAKVDEMAAVAAGVVREVVETEVAAVEAARVAARAVSGAVAARGS